MTIQAPWRNLLLAMTTVTVAVAISCRYMPTVWPGIEPVPRPNTMVFAFQKS